MAARTIFANSSSNPLHTQIGQLIERSISLSESEPRIELFFEICDQINMREENAKDAFKAIRKELSLYKGKNWSMVSKILLLLETCSQNCGRKFQVNLAHKEFLHDLKSMIGPKLQPPLQIQEKVLYLIQLWNNMFKFDQDFKSIESFYKDLRERGVDFPVNTPSLDNVLDDSLSKKLDQSVKISEASAVSHIAPQSHNSGLPSRPVGAIKLNDDQWKKLNGELEVVESNIQVLNEIINELSSRESKSFDQNDQDLVLMKEINLTCREMQKRITQLIGNVSNEGVINELLRINDDLNSVFLRYDRFERSFILKPEKPNQMPVQVAKPEEKPLINFDDDQVDAKQVQINTNNNASNEPDSLSFLEDESEIKEMENWLKNQEFGEKK